MIGMKKHVFTLKAARQRRFYLVLPVLVLPFLALMFSSLGGGTEGRASAPPAIQKGLDPRLPDAYLKNRPALNKMGYYEQAEKDSVSFRKQLERDRYIDALQPSSLLPSAASSTLRTLPSTGLTARENPPGEAIEVRADNQSSDETPDEDPIYRKLSQLKKLIDLPDPPPEFKGHEELYRGNPPDAGSSARAGLARPDLTGPAVSDPSPSDSSFSSTSVRRMEEMMRTIEQSGGDDTEMEQINAILEKILDIQHPERVAEKLKENAAKRQGQVFQVSGRAAEKAISFFGYSVTGSSEGSSGDSLPKDGRGNAFYPLEDNAGPENPPAISAVIYGRQVLESGCVVKLCLSDDIYIGSVLIPRGSFIYGLASFQGNRLDIKIKSIRYRNFLFPVRLAVYDLDGMEGIYVPGSEAGKAARQSASQAMQTFGLQTLEPSLSAEAANAGFHVVRDLLGRHIRTTRVIIRSGYRVLLKDQGESASVIPVEE